MPGEAKTAIVTGASQGIGAGVARAFLKRGYKIVASSRSITEPGDPSEIESVAADDARPDQSLDGLELEAAVAAALREMSPRERAAFAMCRFEGMPYREIAVALSASESAVKSLIHRATLAVARRIETLEAGAEPARSPA